MVIADSETHELSVSQFVVWIGEHCPRLLEGVQHWLTVLLNDDHRDHSDHSDPV